MTGAIAGRQLAPKMKNVGQRVLLLVGEGDWLIPSQSEGKRLEKVLPRCVVKANPHPVTQTNLLIHCQDKLAVEQHLPPRMAWRNLICRTPALQAGQLMRCVRMSWLNGML